MKAILVEVLKALLEAAFSLLGKKMRDTSEDARSEKSMKQSLRDKIKKVWFCVFACLAFSGCGTRTIYVPDGEPVRLRAAIRAARVWVMTGDGPLASTMDLPEGWYCLPMEECEK